MSQGTITFVPKLTNIPTDLLARIKDPAVKQLLTRFFSAFDQWSQKVAQWAAQQGSLASGAIVPVPVASAPVGYLACNGAAVSRTAYAALFAAIGTQFGVGDGSTTFNVPTIANTTLGGVSVPYYVKT